LDFQIRFRRFLIRVLFWENVSMNGLTTSLVNSVRSHINHKDQAIRDLSRALVAACTMLMQPQKGKVKPENRNNDQATLP
jgi:hypothetical protein